MVSWNNFTFSNLYYFHFIYEWPFGQSRSGHLVECQKKRKILLKIGWKRLNCVGILRAVFYFLALLLLCIDGKSNAFLMLYFNFLLWFEQIRNISQQKPAHFPNKKYGLTTAFHNILQRLIKSSFFFSFLDQATA